MKQGNQPDVSAPQTPTFYQYLEYNNTAIKQSYLPVDTTSDSILEVIRKESWILDHFEIFVTIAFNGA